MLCKVIYTCIMCDSYIHKWYAIVWFPDPQHGTGGLAQGLGTRLSIYHITLSHVCFQKRKNDLVCQPVSPH